MCLCGAVQPVVLQGRVRAWGEAAHGTRIRGTVPNAHLPGSFAQIVIS